MLKGFSGLMVVFLMGVALLGAMLWSVQDKSHDMVLRADALESIIDDQRTQFRAGLPTP